MLPVGQARYLSLSPINIFLIQNEVIIYKIYESIYKNTYVFDCDGFLINPFKKSSVEKNKHGSGFLIISLFDFLVCAMLSRSHGSPNFLKCHHHQHTKSAVVVCHHHYNSVIHNQHNNQTVHRISRKKWSYCVSR